MLIRHISYALDGRVEVASFERIRRLHRLEQGFEIGIQQMLVVLLIASQIADRKSTRLNSSHIPLSRMPSSA